MNGMEMGRVCFPATATGWSLSLFARKKLVYSQDLTVLVDSHFPGAVPSDQPL